jgi:hypothetical protein
MRPNPAETAGLLLTAAMRAPFALFWGPACVARRTLHSFVWGAEEPRPCHVAPPAHVWQVSCEPPCYGCQPCRCRHG